MTASTASRASATIIICAVAASVASAALFLPARTDQTVADASAQPASAQAEAAPVDGYGAAAPADPGSNVAAEPATITIEGFAFGTPATVAPGQTISVVNLDGAPHTVTADDGSFDTGTIGGDASGSFTAPTAPGTYSFFCAIHPSMTGTLTVAG